MSFQIRSLLIHLRNYKIIFIIDDSGSVSGPLPFSIFANNVLIFHTSKMSGGRWKQVRAALIQIGNEAMQYDTDGIDICFINSPMHRELVKVNDCLAFL